MYQRPIRVTAEKRQANWQGGKWIRTDKRLAIYLRDGLRCTYCNATVEEGAQLTLDHITPCCYSTKANNSERNLVTCCADCNSSRGNKTLVDWLRKRYSEKDVIAILKDTNKLRKKSIKGWRKTAKQILAERSIREFSGN